MMENISELRREISSLKRLDKARLYDWNILSQRYNDVIKQISSLQKEHENLNGGKFRVLIDKFERLERSLNILIDAVNSLGEKRLGI